MTILHQIEHNNKEIEIIKRNQIEVLELKITTNERRNFTEGQYVWTGRRKNDEVMMKIG